MPPLWALPLWFWYAEPFPDNPSSNRAKQITMESPLPCLAESLGVKLAIEPLHPMYADDRSAINSLASANDVCDELNHPLVGIAYGVYHLWWDPDLEEQTKRTAEADRLFAYHVCDWMTPPPICSTIAG